MTQSPLQSATGWSILAVAIATTMTAMTFLLSGIATPVIAADGIPHGQDVAPGPALTPQQAVAAMQVPEGFVVEVVAAEPDLVNPIAMAFDERGRIWITESLEYPRQSPGVGRDRIKILEDTNADGRVDKVTVFADGLNIPSGIAIGYGGVWVANAPDILFLRDTDGDSKADQSEVVVTGFGRDDTHELPNSLTWGPDGWLYGLNGVFNAGSVTHQGKRHDFTAAIFRIHPRTREFELFAEGTSNPWGIAFDREGSMFLSACVIEHLWHIVESGYYNRQAGAYPPFCWKIESIVEHKHQKAAYCGIHYYDSDAYPPEYRGQLFMGNIHGGCLNWDSVSRKGSTYFGTGNADLMTANDAWFMPVAQKTGPDGCLYVLDWYDQYHCYQDARRDPDGIERGKGRLYRLKYVGKGAKQTPKVEPPKRRPAAAAAAGSTATAADLTAAAAASAAASGIDLATADDAGLIQELGSGNGYRRETAQRLLTERANPKLADRLAEVVMTSAVNDHQRMHALWALVSGGQMSAAAHRQLLGHPLSVVRAWGVRAAGNLRTVSPEILAAVIALRSDSAADVRLQVAIASRKLDGCDALPVLVDLLLTPIDDPLLPRVIWQNLHPLLPGQSDRFLELMKRAEIAASQAGSKEKQAGSVAVAEVMSRAIERILADEKVTAAAIAVVLQRLGSENEADIRLLQQAYRSLATRVQSGEIAGELRKELETSLLPKLVELSRNPAHALFIDALALEVCFGSSAAAETARKLIADSSIDAQKRLQVLRSLAYVNDAAVLEYVLASISNQSTVIEYQSQLIGVLSRLNGKDVAGKVLAKWNEFHPELRPRVSELLTQRPDWARQMLLAISEKRIPVDAINTSQVRKLLALKDAEVTAAVTAQWGTIRDDRNPEREAVVAQMRELLRSSRGDAVRGQAAFRKQCAQCHKLFGEGEEVGPDITGNGRGSFEQLLSNVFDPSLVIGASYQARTVLTTSGKVISGLVTEESPQRVVLKVQGGKLETIPRSDVEEMTVSALSLMPEGLEKQYSSQEIIDLFEYITLDRPITDPAARRLPGTWMVRPSDSENPAEYARLIHEVAPGFGTTAVGERGIGLLPEFHGRTMVLRTHPIDRETPCRLTREIDLPSDKRYTLRFFVRHDDDGDWRMTARVNGKVVRQLEVNSENCRDGWAEVRIDLGEFAGTRVNVELANEATGWAFEFGYWSEIGLVAE